MLIISEVTSPHKDRVKIRVEPNCDCLSRGITYKISLEITPYRKRKSFYLHSVLSDDYNFRRLEFGSKAREDYAKAEVLKYVTEEQLQEAIDKAYQALNPITADVLFCLR